MSVLFAVRPAGTQDIFPRMVAKNQQAASRGSLYPALHRLEQQGWIRAKWAESGTGRQAKFYALTATGRKHFDQEAAHWKRLSGAINLVIQEV